MATQFESDAKLEIFKLMQAAARISTGHQQVLECLFFSSTCTKLFTCVQQGNMAEQLHLLGRREKPERTLFKYLVVPSSPPQLSVLSHIPLQNCSHENRAGTVFTCV